MSHGPAKDADARPPARLLIHSKANTLGGVEPDAGLRLWVRRLQAIGTRDLRQPRPAPLVVRIDDLQGRQWFMHDDGQPLIDVPLPAGTYHISVRRGERRWRYTVALVQGAAFDLYLHPNGEGV